MKGILCLIGFVLWGLNAVAQVGNQVGIGSGAKDLRGIQEFLEMLAEQNEGADMEELEAHFMYLLKNPLDINRVGRDELEQLHLLTDFQIASLLEYRNSSGHILSAAELQRLNGFDESVVSAVLPLIKFGTESLLSESYFAGRRGTDTLTFIEKSTADLLMKWWWKKGDEDYIGPDSYAQIKYKWDFQNSILGGFTLEKDAGERFFPKEGIPVDFMSGYMMAKDIAISRGVELSNIVLGDYSVRLGQGLVMWSGFNFGGSTSVQGLYKKGPQINAYTSSDENDFLRGGAATVIKNCSPGRGIGITAFVSLKNVDARIKDGKYTSLPTDGVHNTESLLETRKTLGEIIYGASLQLWNHKFKFGVNWVGYGYDHHNGRRVQPYNKYQMYDGQWGNLSGDINMLIRHTRLFGELACDYGGNLAFIGGVATRLGKWDFSASIRSYSYKYIAPYSGAYSSISSCSNQNGVQFVAQRNLFGVKFSAGGDFVYYPWKRYNADKASHSVKLWTRAEGGNPVLSWNVKMYGNVDSSNGVLKSGIKGVVGNNIAHFLQVKVRGEVVDLAFEKWGCAVGVDMVFETLSGSIKCVLHGGYYNCNEWECRLYMYEYDLPSSFVSTLQYGEGFGGYAMASCKFGRKTQVYLKGDDALKVRLGLKMRFF